jgi:hypothetical protein
MFEKFSTKNISFGFRSIEFIILMGMCWSRNSVVGIAIGYGLDDRRVEVRVPVVQSGFGTHPVSYAMSAGGSFPGGKADKE